MAQSWMLKKLKKIKKVIKYEAMSQTRICPNCEGIMIPNNSGVYKCTSCKYKDL